MTITPRIVTPAGSGSRIAGSSPKNRNLLGNAWARVLRSSHVLYKNFLRTEISAFGTASEALLDLICDQLQNENYEPQPAYKIHVPKTRYSSRTFILISVPDWVVYTAIATLIMESASKRESELYTTLLYSNRPLSRAWGRPLTFFKSWKGQYALFNRTSKAHVAAGYPFLAEIDLTAFYDLIDHELLIQKIRKYYDDAYSLELLKRLWQKWASGSGGYRFAHGIPQGPEASAFLADLFLFDLDREFLGLGDNCRYVRYVDDIRVFCRTEREAEAQIVRIEQQVKQLGLVPNVKKVRVVDARANLDWIKEESSEALMFKSDFMQKGKPPKSLLRMRHVLAKPTFLENCSKDADDAKSTHLARLSLPKLLPDKQVVAKILEVYESRADLLDLIFMYLQECRGSEEVLDFCWAELGKVPLRDWEGASLIATIQRCDLSPSLSIPQRRLLLKYAVSRSMPLSASSAGTLLLRKSAPGKLQSFLRQLPFGAVYLATWGAAALGLQKRKRIVHRSVKTLLQEVLRQNDDRTSLLAAYLLSTRTLSGAPSTVGSQYAATLLANNGFTTKMASVDEIGPILKRKLRVQILPGFDFRQKLSALHPQLYEKALQHLRLALWYLDTQPTYFVNYMHNFNHVLLHCALHQGGYTTSSIRWKNTFREIQPGVNQTFQANFPAICTVFRECSQARNTDLSSHPYDDAHGRFSTWVTYQQRNALISKLHVAYTEFMVKM